MPGDRASLKLSPEGAIAERSLLLHNPHTATDTSRSSYSDMTTNAVRANGEAERGGWGEANGDTQRRKLLVEAGRAPVPLKAETVELRSEAGMEADHLEDCMRPQPSLQKRLRPTLRLLQIFGFFPGPLRGDGCLLKFFLRFLLVFLIGLNATLSGYTLHVTTTYYQIVGLWHLFTVSSVINTMKPTVNVAHFVLFALLCTRHRRMLAALSRMEEDYRQTFGVEVHVRRWNWLVALGTSVAAFVVLVVRIVEVVVGGERLGQSMLSDVSLVLIPLLMVWNVLPIFYFFLVECLILSWVHGLQTGLEARQRRREESRSSLGQSYATPYPEKDLSLYYQKFLDLTDVQCAVGDVFGPWVLVTLSWGLFILCLTIYFLTKTPPLDSLPSDIIGSLSPEDLKAARITLQFNIVWSLVQVVLAMLAIVMVCVVGTRVNEETRHIMRPIFRSASHQPPDAHHLDKFQVAPSEGLWVSWFMYKLQTQYVWGATVWRAFPIERSVFFTIASLIATYAVLLIKFNSNALGSAVPETVWESIPYADPPNVTAAA